MALAASFGVVPNHGRKSNSGFISCCMYERLGCYEEVINITAPQFNDLRVYMSH